MSADRFSSVGTAIGNISSGQVLQYESSSRIVDGKCKYEEYHESYVKIDGHKTSKEEYKESKGFAVISTQGYEVSRLGKADESRRKKLLGNSYGSFKGLREDRRDSQENTLKSGLPRLVPSVSFNDKILTGSAPKKKLAVFRLSFKRKSSDGEETTQHCKYLSYKSLLGARKFNFHLLMYISKMSSTLHLMLPYFQFMLLLRIRSLKWHDFSCYIYSLSTIMNKDHVANG